MADPDRPDDLPPGGKNDKSRRPPPVIELEAKEVGADGSKTTPKAKPEASEKPEADSKPKAAAADAGLSPLVPAAGAGVIGAIAGAALVYFMLPQLGPAPVTAPSPDPALTKEIAALNAKIETLSKRPAVDQESAALAQRIEKLSAGIADAEKRLQAAANRPDNPQSPAPATPDPALEAISKDLREALAEVRKLSAPAGQNETAAALEALSARIGALDGRMSSLAASTKSTASAELAGEVRALNALAAAINSGRPFVKELAAAKAAMGSKASALDALETSSAKGIAPTQVLANQFSALAPKLLRGPDTDNSFLGKLYSNATKLVEVRKIGDGQGDTPVAVVARAEAMLARGELAAAVSETGKLPSAAKAEAASWLRTANERLAAEAAVRKALDAALASPEQPKS